MEISEVSDRICLSIIIFLILFSFLDFIFLSFVAYYIKKNNNKNITLLWIDYFITITNGFIFSVIYITNLLVNYKNRIKYFEDIYSNKLYILTNSFLMLFFYTSISNLIFDIIKSIQLSYKIMKFKRINNTQDLEQMVIELKLIDIMNYTSPGKHYKFTFVMNVINILIVGFFTIVYIRIDIQNEFFSITEFNRYLLQYYHYFILGILFICFQFINHQKKSLTNKHYYSHNKLLSSIYKINSNELLYNLDILFYKLIVDLIINIPLILYISFLMLNTFAIFVFPVCLFLYIFIGGNILLTIDRNNKYKNNYYVGKIIRPKELSKLFCFKNIHFHFLDSNFNLFMNDYEYFSNLGKEDKEILRVLKINFLEENTIYNKCDSEEYEINSNINSEDNIIDGENSEINTVSEFFVIYKLLYYFFEKNKELYGILLKIVKKNFKGSNDLSSIKKNSFRKNKKQKEVEINNINLQEYVNNINKINSMPDLNRKKLKSKLKINEEKMFTKPEEKELLQELKSKHNKSKEEKFEFCIEALSHSPLFELFPLYQIKLEDIFKSLLPSNNMNVIKNFVKDLNRSNNNNNNNSSSNSNSNNINNNSNCNENQKILENNLNKMVNQIIKITDNDSKSSNENEIIRIDENKNITNDNNGNKSYSDNNESSESGNSNINKLKCYKTYNSLLMIEIYNKSEFMSINNIPKFVISFKNHAIKAVKNMRCTFLPLIMGIFNIRFMGQNKIVIVYRNPLNFINYVYYNEWLQIILHELTEKIIKSPVLNNQTIIIRELVSNTSDSEDLQKSQKSNRTKVNITLNHDDIEDIENNLKSDFDFLIEFQLYPIMHVFVGIENEIENKKLKRSHIFSENVNVGSYGSHGSQQQNISFLLNVSNNSFNSLKRKDLLDENNCILEREYNSANDNKEITSVKLYLTNLFRNDPKEKPILQPINLTNYLKKRIKEYFKNPEYSSSDEKDSENEIKRSYSQANELENSIFKGTKDS